MKPLNRTTARNAALVNLCATPGLGSLMARRWVAGVGQLILAVAGFGLMLGWFVKLMSAFYSLGSDFSTGPAGESHVSISWRLLKWGVAIFAVSWLWSLVTSIQLIRAARKMPPVA